MTMGFADVTLMIVKGFFGYFSSLTVDLQDDQVPKCQPLYNYHLVSCVHWVWSCLFCSCLYISTFQAIQDGFRSLTLRTEAFQVLSSEASMGILFMSMQYLLMNSCCIVLFGVNLKICCKRVRLSATKPCWNIKCSTTVYLAYIRVVHSSHFWLIFSFIFGSFFDCLAEE